MQDHRVGKHVVTVTIHSTAHHHLLTIANEKKFKKGPSTKLSGCTQASVSERSTDEEATLTSASKSTAPAPLFVTKSIASKGDAPKTWLLCVGCTDIKRPALCIGAKPMHGVATKAATIATKKDTTLFIVYLPG
jgi:hypothetical protein